MPGEEIRDEDLNEEINDEEGSEEALDDGESNDDPDEPVYRTQAEFDAAFERKLARERRKTAKMFGVERLEEAAELVQAGAAVTRASGLRPGEVVSRLSGQQAVQQQTPLGAQQPVQQSPVLEQKLDKIAGILETDHSTRVREVQETEAKKEFGDLYTRHKDEIDDKAEELGLPLVDAAAIVLRPKIREHTEKQLRTKQQQKRDRRVEGSEETPGKGTADLASKLSAKQVETAQKYGISLEKYYNQLKRRGKID